MTCIEDACLNPAEEGPYTGDADRCRAHWGIADRLSDENQLLRAEADALRERWKAAEARIELDAQEIAMLKHERQRLLDKRAEADV